MIEKSIKWFTDLKGKVTYSMVYRNGPSSYDCSSAEYYALINAGLLPAGTRIGNTDSLYNDLERNGWTKVPADASGYIAAQRGDVFLWGVRGASGGASGHTGTFVDADNIIHCNYGYNGITINNHDWLWGYNGSPAVTIYRYTGAPYTPPSIPGSPTDQLLDVGSYVKFTNTYRVDDAIVFAGTWQVRSNELCKNNFTWEENGIPVEPLVEVDASGYPTPDQELDIGSQYKILGKYQVLDLGFIDDMWLAQIEHGGLKFWVDVKTATEVAANDPGTPMPKSKPPVVPPVIQPPKPVPETPVIDTPATPPETNPPPAPSVPTVPTPPIVTPTPTNPKEDNDMAFTKAQTKELKIATESVQNLANKVAVSEAVEEIVSGVSKKTKLIVYLVGDALIGAGLLVPGLALTFNFGELVQVTALSNTLAIGGAFLLTMFGIYKDKN